MSLGAWWSMQLCRGGRGLQVPWLCHRCTQQTMDGAVSGLSWVLLASMCPAIRQLLLQHPSAKLGSWHHRRGLVYWRSQLVARKGGEVTVQSAQTHSCQESCCQSTAKCVLKGCAESVPRCDVSVLQVLKQKQKRLAQLPWHRQLSLLCCNSFWAWLRSGLQTNAH